MAGYRPVYADNSQQPSNSRYNHDRVLRKNERQSQQVQHPAYQVDSWRSYRNDATNLQQMTTITSNSDHNYTVSDRQLQWSPNQYNLNPEAPAFQPMGYTGVSNSVQSQFTPYQPLRISNGQSERIQVHQARSSSLVANNRGRGTYALRSQGPANQSPALYDIPIPSTEYKGTHSSSIPINFGTLIANEARFRRVTSRGSPSASPPPAPSVAPEYLAQASLTPEYRKIAQNLLVVLDLNGTLLFRARSRGTSFTLRPGVTNFMDYLFTHHTVMIYTSSRPENAQGMVKKLFSPKQCNQLAAVWARDKLDLTDAQYNAKVQVYKKLEKIWADEEIQKRAGKGQKWDQSNTVLVDDSHLKALAQPYNLLKVEEFLNDRPARSNYIGKINDQKYAEDVNMWSLGQQRILKDLQTKLEQLKNTMDVSRLIRMWQLEDTDKSETTGQQSVEPEQVQLLTPKSPDLQTAFSDHHDGGVRLGLNDVNDLFKEMDNSQAKSGGDVTGRSVSPIDESVWKDILGDSQIKQDEPPTPKSVDE